MTAVANMILNELPISQSLREKIDFIKANKLDFKDFNNFRLLLNSLESFEPNTKLSDNVYKEQINAKIEYLVHRLNFYEQKIKEDLQNDTKDLHNKDSQENEAILQNTNENSSNRSKFFALMSELEDLSAKEEHSQEKIGFMLERVSEFLLNAEGLNENEMTILEEAKEALAQYHLSLQDIKNDETEEDLKDLPLYENTDLQEKSLNENYELTQKDDSVKQNTALKSNIIQNSLFSEEDLEPSKVKRKRE